MCRLSRSKSSFWENQIFWSKRGSIPIQYRPRWSGDQHTSHRMGFTPNTSDHAKCGVYISANPITPSAEEFISSIPNIEAKSWNLIDIEFCIKKSNRNQMKGKKYNSQITSIVQHDKYSWRTFPLQCTASEWQTASVPSETQMTTYYSFNLTHNWQNHV